MKRIVLFALIVIILSIFGFTIFYTLDLIKPSGPPKPMVFNYKDDYWKGQYVFSFAKSRAGQNIADANYIVIMDEQGNYINYVNSSRYNFNYIYQLTENEIFYYARPANWSDQELVPDARIWNFRTGATRTILDGIDISGHHEFLIEDGYFVTLRRVPGHEGGLDTVVHLDPETGNETWLWSSEPLFPEKVCQMCSDDDWTHGNDVTISLDGKYYFVNFRNTDNFVKVNRETKDVEWICGYNGNFTLLENGIEKESLWYHSHIIKEIEPNVFIMFDNDFHNLLRKA